MKRSKHYPSSQVLEGSTLDLKQQDILKQSSSLNTTPTANTSSKDIGQMSLFGEMSKPLTQTVAEKLTASLVATHANPSPLPGSKKARKMTATSGRECLKLLNTKDPLSSFARTCLVTLSWVSMKCYLTWKVKATPRGRLLFQLQQLMPTIKESVSGLWPTPNAWDGNRGPRSQKNLREKNHQINLITAVKDAQSPKPVKMWPTPRSTSHSYLPRTPELIAKTKRNPQTNTLEDAVQYQEGKSYKITGALNADWVEWLMGFPRGWTSLTSQELQQIKQGGCKD
nr:hypothetical protein [uncultured Mediterranean phage uvMED]